MNVLKDVLIVIGTVIGVILTVLLAIYITVVIGYLFGIVFAILPFVGGWLTAGLPITTSQIPGIVAWLAVAGMFIGGSSYVSKNKG